MRSFTLLNVAKPFLLACNEPSRCFPNIPKIGATTMNNNKKRVLPLRCKSFWLSLNGDWLEVPKEIDNEEEFIVVNFYRFVFIEDPEEEVNKHLSFLEGRDIHGRIYLNKQGINAQYSGPNKDALAYVKWVREDCRFSDVLVQISPASNGHAFPRLKLRYKPSLVQASHVHHSLCCVLVLFTSYFMDSYSKGYFFFRTCEFI
ncbi:hypothetical protein MTR67_051871 [Solanum verrucosum]|uniref:tRNA uridine(34) hydroxylase N-terminal domain-containing protein n=1 Tax=Solanum verrucosum TaxID=315347 RepID=A0AAF1A0I0_SOLVR|nr:hypothetical protein MTR67_051871 [Solanum verrucosum]